MGFESIEVKEVKKRLNRIVLGLKLVECKSEKPKFLAILIPTLPSGVGGGHTEDSGWNNRRPRLKQQKTLTETIEDSNWNNMSFFHILINFHHSDRLANHQKLNVIYKNEYLIFWSLRGPLSHFGWLSLLGLLGRSPEVECNPKMSISYFWLERGGRWVLSPSTSPTDLQKLNVIQKWAFHFFGWRRVADGVWVHRLARPIIRSYT